MNMETFLYQSWFCDACLWIEMQGVSMHGNGFVQDCIYISSVLAMEIYRIMHELLWITIFVS